MISINVSRIHLHQKFACSIFAAFVHWQKFKMAYSFWIHNLKDHNNVLMAQILDMHSSLRVAEVTPDAPYLLRGFGHGRSIPWPAAPFLSQPELKESVLLSRPPSSTSPQNRQLSEEA